MTTAADRVGGGPALENRQSLLQSVIGWLRAGYPEGVPDQDYVPLLVLMRRRLTDDEISVVSDAMVRDGRLPFGDTDIGVLITKVTNELPAETDIARVRERLAAFGWPLDPPRVGGFVLSEDHVEHDEETVPHAENERDQSPGDQG